MSTSDQHNEQHTGANTDDLHADGIVENRETKPPGYFNLLYYGLIIWGVIFMGYYLFSGWSSDAEFNEKMAAHEATYAKVAEAQAAAPVATASIDAKALFADNCAMCHGDDGKGGIGPDLTGATYIYGRETANVKVSIADGRDNGMPGYASQFSGAEVDALVDYVLTLK